MTHEAKARRDGLLVAAVSAGFVLLGAGLGDSVPWYATAFFALCCVAGLISAVRPRAPVREVGQLTIDDVGITRTSGAIREHVAWNDVVRVRIMTSDRGPWSEDVLFVIDGESGNGCVVGHDLAVRAGLLEALQSRLAGLDNGAVIEAMGSTENRAFTIWEKGRP
jgi:hypothetical protein